MKPETKTADLRAYIARENARQTAQTAARRAAAAIRSGNAPEATQTAQDACRAAADAQTADEAFRKLPPVRRNLAETAHRMAQTLAHTIAANLGGSYSGSTLHAVGWGEVPLARTITTLGDQYSRSCRHRKTNATHRITLDPAGIPLLVESEPLRLASDRDGLPLIALYPDGSAVWARTKGKAVISERGWVAFAEGHCHHSTASLADAQTRLKRKLATLRREREAVRESRKRERRARLVARLCSKVTATIEDARALGFCAPGIRAFQDRYGIGDTATLPELIRTGDPSAVRLALSIARNLNHTKP